ncbi:MAG TPA: ABC transporter permease [Alphaproteobacteria bacterium]|nr:ABC transporter permease [Alphaproteobacteria bacterium]
MTARLLRMREIWLALAILAMLVAIETRAPGFAQPANLASVFNDSAILIILALGQMTVILTRSIDLSIASNVALSGMVIALINSTTPGIPVPALIALACLHGTALGAFNGVLVWKLGIPSIVVTLGTLTIFRGVTFLIAGGQWVNADELTPDFIEITRIGVAGLPLLSWFAIAIAAAFYVVMTRTPVGRAIYAIGVNPTGAVYAGIDVGRTMFLAFCISGFVAGLCGYLWVSKFVIASSETAIGYELQVIAACVIGGVSIAGGVGSVGGAILGALFLGLIGRALPVIQVSPFWQMAIVGAAIILAVILNARAERRTGRIILRSAEGRP